jgi:hypothetical protein
VENQGGKTGWKELWRVEIRVEKKKGLQAILLVNP